MIINIGLMFVQNLNKVLAENLIYGIWIYFSENILFNFIFLCFN